MTTVLPRDADDNAIQALKPLDGGAHHVAYTGTAARNTTAFDSKTRVIIITASSDCYYKLGGSGVTATSADHFLPGGSIFYLAVGGGKGTEQSSHISVIQSSDAGTLHISELQ